MIWYWLQLKAILRSKGLYLQLLGMIALLVLIANISIPDGKNTRTGIYIGKSEYALEIMQELNENKSVFTYLSYEDKELLKEDVRNGHLECGFVFDDDFDRMIEQGNIEKAVDYFCSPDTTKGAVIQENIYAHILKLYSRSILSEYDNNLYEEFDSKRLEELLAKNDSYINSGALFSIKIIEMPTAKQPAEEEKTRPLVGMAAFLLFLIMYLYAGKRWNDSGNVIAALNFKSGFLFDVCGEVAAGTIPFLISTIMLICAGEFEMKATVGMLFSVFYGAVWISFVIRMIRSQTAYYASVIVISILMIMLFPVFVDIAAYVPAVRYIRVLFPMCVAI